jgi:hypothetical protein
MLEIAAPQPSSTSPQPAAAQTAPELSGVSFHDVLSALNPLQYLPVIGTIYRAVTGDEVPEPVRRVGSAICSLLTGGPIGLVVNIALLGAEKASGIDLDAIGQSLIGGKHGVASPDATQQAAPVTAAPPPWSPAQRAAYGIGGAAGDPSQQNDLSGADRLNAWELVQLHSAQSAYARTMAIAG